MRVLHMPADGIIAGRAASLASQRRIRVRPRIVSRFALANFTFRPAAGDIALSLARQIDDNALATLFETAARWPIEFREEERERERKREREGEREGETSECTCCAWFNKRITHLSVYERRER